MPRLALSFLGQFQASAGDRTITNFATDKVRALLAYLAVEADRPHRRDTLAALLWPGWDDSGARSNLRLALHRLREALDAVEPTLSDELFGVTRETVQIHGRAVEVDVARFEALLEMCELHPHRLLHLCPSCLEQLGEAAALYSGELLAGLSIGDAPGFEQWELTRREELGRRVLGLLYRLADAFEQLGEYGRGLLFAHRQLALDPYREEAHRQVIRFYTLQGERAAALAHFERVRQLLAVELGVEPDPATVALIEQVRTGGLAGLTRSSANGHEGRPLLHHFPAQFTPFHGRAAEIAQLVSRLIDRPDVSTERLHTIVAPGGMGKTRLAIAAAEALAERPGFSDGIYFLPLARVASADLLPSALATALNINMGGAVDPVDQLAGFLRPMRALLVVDNFEHLLDGVDTILRLLEEAPGLWCLVTSREALNVRGESRFVLGGLDDAAAEALFTGAAARVRPGYEPGPADREAIRAIGRDVGGMPLAIELAATWVRLMDVPAIAARIRADIDFLTTTLRDLPARQRSMRAVFDYMWATLSPPEREALARLSVLCGPFRLDAAEAVGGASPEVLAALLDQSLLATRGGGRFEVHELLRQYAAGHLAFDPDHEAAARARHAAYYLALLARHGETLGRPGSKEALAALLRNLDNVRTAWEWAVVNGRLDDISPAADTLEMFFRFSGLPAEGSALFAAAAAALQGQIESGRLSPAVAWPVIYRLWRREALLLELTGLGEAALARLSGARAGWAALGNDRRLARVLIDMAYVNMRLSRPTVAGPLAEEALARARALGDDRLIAGGLHNLGNAANWLGDTVGGRMLLEESISHYRAAGEWRWLAGALSDIGMAYSLEGDLASAKAAFQRSVDLAESIGDQTGIALAVSNLGAVALDSGDLEAAETFSRRGQAIAQDIGDKLMLSVCLGNLGHVTLTQGERAAALRTYRDAAVVCRESGYGYMLIEIVMGLAALAAGRDAGAATRWLGAVAAWRATTGFGGATPFVQRMFEETENRLRMALGEEAYAAAWAAGEALSLAAAAAEAMSWAQGEG
ncbi:MAG: BTAD domain-containing putative transcriptional regulator [Chloroflexota bacterium]